MNTAEVPVECLECAQSFSAGNVEGLLTCPHCQAAFRLPPEELAAAKGWDRPAIRRLVEDFHKQQQSAEAVGEDPTELQDRQLDRVLQRIASLPAAERERIAREFDEENEAVGREESDDVPRGVPVALKIVFWLVVWGIVIAWIIKSR